MQSIAFKTTGKIIIVFCLSCCFFACNNKAEQFDSQCQGWNDESALSNTIFNKLNEHNFTRYLAIKTGTDRDTYDFSFLGQTSNSGVLIHSDGIILITATTSLTETNKIFSLLPDDIQKLQGYAGSGDVWSHLFCAYLTIKTPEHTKTLSYHDYIFKPENHMGLITLERLDNYFRNELLKPSTKKLSNMTTIKVETIPDLDKKIKKALIMKRKQKPVFYEIP